MTFTFIVYGIPAPQGSKRAFVNRRTGRANLVEMSAKVKPWREAVRRDFENATQDEPWTTILGPVELSIHFWLPRPKSHYGTGANAGKLKASAPSWVTTTPDVDKAVRSTLDALTASGAFRDDRQVVDLHATKHYADGYPGACILIREIT